MITTIEEALGVGPSKGWQKIRREECSWHSWFHGCWFWKARGGEITCGVWRRSLSRKSVPSTAVRTFLSLSRPPFMVRYIAADILIEVESIRLLVTAAMADDVRFFEPCAVSCVCGVRF